MCNQEAPQSWKAVIEDEIERGDPLPGAMHCNPDYAFISPSYEDNSKYNMRDKNDNSDESLWKLTEEQVNDKLKEWNISLDSGWF